MLVILAFWIVVVESKFEILRHTDFILWKYLEIVISLCAIDSNSFSKISNMVSFFFENSVVKVSWALFRWFYIPNMI